MKTTLKVHGLTNDWTEPDWPFLTLEEVDALLRRLPEAGGAEQIVSYSPRPFSAASVVLTPRGRVFVKRHHRSVRNYEELHEEHRLLKFLRSEGAPVAALLADATGETVFCEGDWTYEVHSIPTGLDLYEKDSSWTPFRSASHAREAGRALGRLHAVLANYDASARRTRTLVSGFSVLSAKDIVRGVEQYIASRPELKNYLEARNWRERTAATLSPLHAKLKPLLPQLQSMWTHNDFHASNLFWSSAAPDAEVTAIIDFGLADRTTAIYDLATAIDRNGVRWLELDRPFEDVVALDQSLSLLRGYEEAGHLSSIERHALVAMLPVVHAEFALSETDYFVRVLRSEEKASLAWDGYFLGHAAWFRSENGQRLLAALEAWAESERPEPACR